MLTASAFAQSPQRAQFPNDTYSLVQIADGIHAFIAPEPGSGIVQGNITLIIGEESCLVVDTGQFPLLAERMVADIRKLTPKPVKYVLNTHWHGDHLLVNVAFQKAWPSATFISTGFTRRKIA
ncbi:MAG TPA: MBL fold metallo-hydrolase [Terriglobales bacterium]|nr:MBL fold metallo-hydrolase [Terriglobales bacterium]